MLAGVRYFAYYVMDDLNSTTWLFLAVVSPALFTTPIWRRLGERAGKLKGYVIASITLTVATFALTAAPWLPRFAIYMVIMVIGFGYAGQQLFGLAMLPDCIAFDEKRTGKRQAGVFTGVWTAGETLGLALGPGIYAFVLELFNYVPNSTGEFLAQSSMAGIGVLLGFTLVPAFIVGIALALLRGYDLAE
jgi:Na+/melibiose symporter-like transporter